LKVINTRFIGDESARRRFVREARAAASVSHPNVASVFHLGMSDEGYFYAMEFIEGETLENLIKRRGRLEPKSLWKLRARSPPVWPRFMNRILFTGTLSPRTSWRV
jgi:serine/threonine protein kinase